MAMWHQQAINLLIIGAVMLSSCMASERTAADSGSIRGNEMDRVNVTVSIDEAYLNQFQQITEAMQATGLEIDRTMPRIGIVTGSIHQDRISALDEIEGVEHVERERTYQLAPPDSEIQ